MSRALLLRLGLGVVVAGGLILALQALVSAAEPGPGAEVAVLPVAVPAGLWGAAERLLLARRVGDLGASVAPVGEVTGDGRLRLVRPGPPAQGPGGNRWPTAGCLLPVATLDALTPAQTGAFLALCRALGGRSGLRSHQVESAGVAVDHQDLARWLRWQR